MNRLWGDENGARKYPERILRGDNHPSRLHPEKMARGDTNGARSRPECLARGENHGSKTCPDKVVRGEKHYTKSRIYKIGLSGGKICCKLDEVKVREIRASYAVVGTSQRVIALKFGVTRALIGMIVRRDIWREVP